MAPIICDSVSREACCIIIAACSPPYLLVETSVHYRATGAMGMTRISYKVTAPEAYQATIRFDAGYNRVIIS
jgi:hypothetical protein